MAIPASDKLHPPLSQQASVRRGRSLIIWTLCCIAAAVQGLVYLSVSRAAGGGQPILPLDDVYIHFQYAHTLASGFPYAYNPGLPPTSGATSFLYPYALAAGDLIGFRGLNLGLWALALGAVALAISGWLVFRIGRALGSGDGPSLAVTLAFMINGATAWHFFSGMETGLAVLWTLGTFYGLAARKDRLTIGAAALLALTRPEGGLTALIVAGALAWRWRGEGSLAQRWPLLIAPAAALGVQPLVNWLVTGSPVASGNLAKSLFGIIPPEMSAIIGRILAQFGRMWREFLELPPGLPVYVGVPMTLLAALGLIALLRRRDRRLIGVAALLILLAGTAAVSTLDTAFWHFKRYQMPLLVLFFPLAIYGAAALRRPARFSLLAFALLIVPISARDFLYNYALNVGYVAAQPLPMARWLAANAPPDDVIAVHDVGMMRYAGGRTTLDMVGLTTPGAADAWRNGPGAVGEFLERARPDLIAAYGHGHGYGLGYLEDTDLYGDLLAEFRVTLDPARNVALAAARQGIYRPLWEAAERGAEPVSLPFYTRYLGGVESVDSVDVADLASEREHAYTWRESRPIDGFPTEWNQFVTVGCPLDDCAIMDGGRRINGEEAFTLMPEQAGAALVLVTRVHSGPAAGRYTVYANDVLVAERVIPPLPGAWLEIPVLIPPEQVTEMLRIRIVPQGDGDYMPYMHWAYLASYPPNLYSGDALTTFQDGAIVLGDFQHTLSVTLDGRRLLEMTLLWATDGTARGDYKVFVHLVDDQGQIAAQVDTRPAGGLLPPGNWLAGFFYDRMEIDVTALPAGTYTVLAGLYDPVSGERLTPSAGDAFNQVMLGEIALGR